MRTSRTLRRRALTLVLVASVAAVPTLMLVALPTLPGCGSGDALGLEDWQRDLLFGFGSLAIGLLNSGAAGPAGQPGLACWDLNGNGVGDAAEDINGDGVFDALDCQGAPGAPAEVPDDAGQPVPSVPGEMGPPGLSCWDLNGDGIQDAEEDVNGDGVFDALDCQGAEGPAGVAGAVGLRALPVSREQIAGTRMATVCVTRATSRMVYPRRPPRMTTVTACRKTRTATACAMHMTVRRTRFSVSSLTSSTLLRQIRPTAHSSCPSIASFGL